MPTGQEHSVVELLEQERPLSVDTIIKPQESVMLNIAERVWDDKNLSRDYPNSWRKKEDLKEFTLLVATDFDHIRNEIIGFTSENIPSLYTETVGGYEPAILVTLTMEDPNEEQERIADRTRKQGHLAIIKHTEEVFAFEEDPQVKDAAASILSVLKNPTTIRDGKVIQMGTGSVAQMQNQYPTAATFLDAAKENMSSLLDESSPLDESKGTAFIKAQEKMRAILQNNRDSIEKGLTLAAYASYGDQAVYEIQERFLLGRTKYVERGSPEEAKLKTILAKPKKKVSTIAPTLRKTAKISPEQLTIERASVERLPAKTSAIVIENIQGHEREDRHSQGKYVDSVFDGSGGHEGKYSLAEHLGGDIFKSLEQQAQGIQNSLDKGEMNVKDAAKDFKIRMRILYSKKQSEYSSATISESIKPTTAVTNVTFDIPGSENRLLVSASLGDSPTLIYNRKTRKMEIINGTHGVELEVAADALMGFKDPKYFPKNLTDEDKNRILKPPVTRGDKWNAIRAKFILKMLEDIHRGESVGKEAYSSTLPYARAQLYGAKLSGAFYGRSSGGGVPTILSRVITPVEEVITAGDGIWALSLTRIEQIFNDTSSSEDALVQIQSEIQNLRESNPKIEVTPDGRNISDDVTVLSRTRG